MSSTLTRRELLQCVGAAGLVAAGCSDDPTPPAADAAVADAAADSGAMVDAGFDAGKVTVDAGGDAGVDAGRDVPRGDAETRSGTVFLHGVASGDPLADAVILWTRVTLPAGMTGDVTVTWEASRTLDFAAIAAMGTFTTNAARDYTVKVDASGLTAGTTYYYRFRANGMTSPVGRTRTTATGALDRARLAVVSCSSMGHGYFHTYRALSRRLDLDAVVHLGDYIYEYGNDEYGNVRHYDPPTEIVSLSDYRRRHAHYKRDADLRAAHQQHPFIAIWDDHEFADNTWEGGAENHKPMTEGAWAARKAAAEQAYFEWMPIREQSDRRIYRRIQFGSLIDLVLIDTRVWGRQMQTMGMNPPFSDPARTLLGAAQEQWFLEQISTSRATWKLVGQQVMMGQLPQFLNTDAWDGYPAARARFFSLLRTMRINDVVVLTGDIHSSWAMDLTETPTDAATYDPMTGRGSLAVEFVTPAVTSPGFPPGIVTNTAVTLLARNTHMKYFDLVRRGFLVIDATPTRLQGAFFHYEHGATFVPDAVTEAFSSAWSTVPGRNHLERDSMAAMARPDPAAAAPAEVA
ncbi:MAG: alkaline phosphatase D family protein [Myxococcales bacterium]|nr:alkaline phosphatase D family protein [Myxococcales bacterium]